MLLNLSNTLKAVRGERTLLVDVTLKLRDSPYDWTATATAVLQLWA